MSVLSAIPILGGLLAKIFDRALPDKSKSNEAQTRINEAEISGAPASRLRLWRSFLGWILATGFVWEVIGRPIMLTYWPDTVLPPSMLKEILTLLMAMLGFA